MILRIISEKNLKILRTTQDFFGYFLRYAQLLLSIFGIVKGNTVHHCSMTRKILIYQEDSVLKMYYKFCLLMLLIQKFVLIIT